MERTNTYIKNLKGLWIFEALYNNKEYDISGYRREKIYSATMPYSIQIERLNDYYSANIYTINGKQYTDDFINVTFGEYYKTTIDLKDKDGKVLVDNETGEILQQNIKFSKKDIRTKLYLDGFTIGEDKYVFFMRGASKARTGSDIFCKKEIYDTLIKRNRLGLDFAKDEEVDLTSLNAYQSLITSHVEFTINLTADEIMIVDDIYGKVVDNYPASVTEWVENLVEVPYGKKLDKKKLVDMGYLKTYIDEHYKQQNCLTDGESLCDESVFIQQAQIDKYKNKYKLIKSPKKSIYKIKYTYGNIHTKSMMLLRSDLLKSCAFNTKLQAFWKANGVATLEEKIDGVPTGRILDATKVKLVITPNSLKFLKFAYKFTESKTIKEYNELSKDEQIKVKIKCYRYWLDNIDNKFGVVKTDHEGNFGTYNRLTYQLLNSFPNLSYDDVKELAQDEIDYVMKLKNVPAYFRNYIGVTANKIDDMDFDINNYFEDENSIEDIEDKYKSLDTFNNILSVNSNIQYTKEFAQFREEQIGYYVDNLRHGKIRMKDTIYATIFANPYEFLMATIGKYTEGEVIATGTEMYCKYYDNKNIDVSEGFCVSRNPHVNAGNIMYMTFKKHDEYKWFNLNNNIIVVNINDNDLPNRGEGFDVDSDTLLITPNKILARRALDCQKYPTPICNVKAKKTVRHNSLKELAELDDMLSNNYIGKIINKSQILNSYMNDAIANGKDQKLIDKLYEMSSLCSSLSQIEIDKAKKTFDNIKMAKELAKINHVTVEIEGEPVNILRFIEEMEKDKKTGKDKKVNKMIVPEFFNYVAEDNTYRKFEGSFKTPMDYLQDIIDKGIKNKTRCDKGTTNKTKDDNKPLKFRDLLVKVNDLDKANTSQKKDLFKIIDTAGKSINSLKIKNKVDKYGNPIKLSDKAKKTITKNIKAQAINDIVTTVNNGTEVSRKVNAGTILTILKDAFPTDTKKKKKKEINKKIKAKNELITDDKKKIKKVTTFSNYARLTLTLLYNAKLFETLKCFKAESNADEEILLKCWNGDINIFGTRYKLIKIKDINKGTSN